MENADTKIAIGDSKTIGEGKVQLRWPVILAEAIWKYAHTEHGGEKKKAFWLFSVIFLVFHFCLVTIFNQRECVRSTLAWVQERMEV